MPDCSRCGRDTDETTLEGKPLCRECQDDRRDQDATRELGQSGLGEWE